MWAKSGAQGGHGLLAHMLDVAAVVEALLKAEPPSTLQWAAQAFGLPEQATARWLATLAGLHDFGKAIPGFQTKWPEGEQQDMLAGLPFTARSQVATDHACATAALLGEVLQLGSGAERAYVRHVLQAISAHHGYTFGTTEVGAARPLGEGSEWRSARQALFDAYWATLSPPGQVTAAELGMPAVAWLAGVTSVADWIASNPEWFALGERHNRLDAYVADAEARAVRALAAIGWSSFRRLLNLTAPTDELLGRMAGRHYPLAPRPLQREGDRLLAGAKGPALLLVEAPMGEGKTELAFLAHLRLQAANEHRGLYVALPTQATGNALFERALTFLRAFAGHAPLDMQLVHGGAALDERVQHLRNIFGAEGEGVSASAWFSQRRRPLLSPYGVGTVDQALFAVLNVKHHFVRLWGLSNRVVVLDEVHAYDTYTTGLIEALLHWLKALGSSVVLMSATLPHARQAALLRAWGTPLQAVPELPYPRLLLADDRGVEGATFASRPMPPIHLSGVGETLEDLVACALAQWAQGGCGAVIVNTVDRAQQLYRHLRQQLGEEVELLLFHARFPADQRRSLEQAVLARFGHGADRPAQALLIATQVAEQSLDIDFDYMLTDLAPVDLLLQRAGRLHRHQRVRPPAHAVARLFVAGLQMDRLPDLKATAWQYVYDAYILGRTWALLSRDSVLQLPQDIDRLVQAVYGGEDLPDELEAKARDFIEGESFGEYRARVNLQQMQAVQVSIFPQEEPQNAYLQKPRGSEEGDGLGLVNRTRLGDDSTGFVPVHVVAGGWSLDPGGPAFDPEVLPDDALAHRLVARQVRLSRKAVVKHFEGVAAPKAFTEHPLLRHLQPIPLVEGRHAIGASLTLCLDDVMGIVYDRSET